MEDEEQWADFLQQVRDIEAYEKFWLRVWLIAALGALIYWSGSVWAWIVDLGHWVRCLSNVPGCG
jgi:hypothetical protein